ncbi:hypothetical protein [Methanobacterium oryzae]|uniref:hypothetical protein n=1 Tax=Methanobacterium oryzae TaxID=69540 RepID=UPI003D243FB7
MVFLDLIFRPLLRQLDINEIERAIDNIDNTQPCTLNEIQLLNITEDQVKWCINKKEGIRRIKLVSTLHDLKLHELDEVILLQNNRINAKIRRWSKKERAIFMSLHINDYLWDDFKSPIHHDVFVEIDSEFLEEDGSIRSGILFDMIDLIKWVFMVLSKNPMPIAEGTCIMGIEGTGITPRFRHDEKQFGGNVIINRDMAERAKDLINAFYSTSEEFEDLWVALKFFGRACLAKLEIDSLIESVIGLEKLLVGRDNLSYQFRLHGATIFSTRYEHSKISDFENEGALFESKDKLVNWFNKLYGKRSNFVHGNYKETDEYAKSAIYALAVIIEGIIYLQNKGLLEYELDGKKVIYWAIGQYVIEKAVFKNID